MSTYHGKVVGIRTVDHWSTKRLRWFTVTIAQNVIDLSQDLPDKQAESTNIDLVIDDPKKLPSIGQMVRLDITFIEEDQYKLPSTEEEE